MRKVYVLNYDPQCFESNVVFPSQDAVPEVDRRYAVDLWLAEEGDDLSSLTEGRWYEPPAATESR
jgi:hypothetical protein